MASGPVIINPREVRRFASQLKQFTAELSAGGSRLHAQFKQLGETWRDPAYVKFAEEFTQTMKNLQRFSRVAEEVHPRLVKTAERAEAVHT
jgi:WXG100 family type VII secretion target